MTIHEYTPWIKQVSLKSPMIVGSFMSQYFNREDVRKELNIPDDVPEWHACRSRNEEGSLIFYTISA